MTHKDSDKVANDSIEVDVVNLIVLKKLKYLMSRDQQSYGNNCDIQLSELKRYLNGKPIPLCRLYTLFRFYEPNEEILMLWNLNLAVSIYKRLKKKKSRQE